MKKLAAKLPELLNKEKTAAPKAGEK